MKAPHEMRKTIVVRGRGLIADATAAALDGLVEVGRLATGAPGAPAGPGALAGQDATAAAPDVLASSDGLIVASDCWGLTSSDEVYKGCQEAGVPWMPVHTELGTAVIGPVTYPGRPGCPSCFETRRKNNSPAGAARSELHAANADTLAATPSAMLTPIAADLIGMLAAIELTRYTAEEASVLIVRLDDLSIERHRFLPDPLCLTCGNRPDDDRETARISLSTRPKADPARYRLWSPTAHSTEIAAAYVDPEAGVINRIVRSDECGLAVAEAPITLPSAGARVPGGGRTWDYRTSDVVAVLEALERLGGCSPVGKRTVVRAAMEDLQDTALDPRTLGMHEDDLYEIAPKFYRPFTEEAVCNWVWGYSLTAAEPVLVPETCAYFWTLNRPDPAFFAENTNGCALGSCLEEAILYGILEVAERDAFLLTWHSQIPSAPIDLEASDFRDPAISAAAITQATGYDVTLFDVTTEFGIPSVWAMATHPGLRDSAMPDGTDEIALFCAAGSSLSPERAALSAVLELGPQLANAIKQFPARKADAATSLDDPSHVNTIFDHAVAFGDPRAYERLDFLTGSAGNPIPLAGLGGQKWPANTDLREDLLELVDRFRREGMDVIVVDETSPDHRAIGLHCVKVLIPGMLPLTYGHRRRRLRNLPRLLTLPQRLGHATTPLSVDDINQLPHPFAA
jgi:ribosomal protein S12 methylthiotransferase accessory factor